MLCGYDFKVWVKESLRNGSGVAQKRLYVYIIRAAVEKSVLCMSSTLKLNFIQFYVNVNKDII